MGPYIRHLFTTRLYYSVLNYIEFQERRPPPRRRLNRTVFNAVQVPSGQITLNVLATIPWLQYSLHTHSTLKHENDLQILQTGLMEWL